MLHHPRPDAGPEDCVVLSQRDVRELQFAKAAISTGSYLLLEELGLEHGDVQQVLMAGSFGSYISPASAVRIGLVPKLPVLRIVSAGNVAGEGREDGAAVGPRARRRGGAARGGDLCRASPTAPTSTTGSSTSSGSDPASARPGRVRRHQPARGGDRGAPGLAGRRTPAAAAAAQPAATDRRRGPRRWPSGCWRRATGWWSAMPTAGRTARSTRSAATSESSGCPASTATTCSPGPSGWPRSSRSSPAPTSSPTSWSGRSRAPCCASSGSTGIPSCATTTSAPTPGSCGWPRSRTTSCTRWPTEAAAAIGLPLTVVDTGHAGLESALEGLVSRGQPDSRLSQSCRQASVSATWLNV